VLGGVLPFAVAPAQQGAAPIGGEYQLVVGDQIQVVVEQHDSLNRSYIVPVEGEVAFPPIGKITLLGKSVDTISKEIKQGLIEKDQFADPEVFVLLTAYAPRQAFLWGAASGPVDLVPHKRHTLLQVLSMARVDAGTADFRAVKVRRTSKSGKVFSFEVNLADVVAKDDFEADVIVMPDDIIYVPSFQDLTQTAWVYILGKVNNPGRFGFIPKREKLTLAHLVTLAGDFHQFADEGKIKILRHEKTGTRLINVDFDDIIDLTITDPVMEPDDLVYVPESFF
jgi:polysaccharide export outer membrane protein